MFPHTFEQLNTVTYLRVWLRIFLVTGVIHWILKKRFDSWSSIYLLRPTLKEISIGALFFITLAYSDRAPAYFAKMSALDHLLQTRAGIGNLGAWLYQNPLQTIVLLALPVGVYEELLYAYLFVALSMFFKSKQPGMGGMYAALVVSVLFGFSHLYQGSYQFYEAFVHRLLYILMLVWRRNLTPLITGHILYDVNILLGNTAI